MNFFNVLITSLIISIYYFGQLESLGRGGGGGRGGGSRGGGSRGGSRSRYGSSRFSSGGYRSKTFSTRYKSNVYNSWSVRHGYSNSFSYKQSSYYTKHRGITLGLILVSSRHRHRISYTNYNEQYDIPVCVNIYDSPERNVSISPWFVCPWDDDLTKVYCCGYEFEETCCRYFDRPGHLAGLIIGIILIIFITCCGCCCCCGCCKSKKKAPAENIVENNTDKSSPENVSLNPIPYPNAVPPPYPVDASSTDPSAPYPKMDSMPQPQQPPLPPSAGDGIGYENVIQPPLPPTAGIGIGYDNAVQPPYPLNPPTNAGDVTISPPPSYESIVKT